jgi:formylglycine-generating enzyme required for sulfatase activity
LFVDRQVNGADLGALLSQWGPANSNTISDLNRDGQVNGADLGILLNAWGLCRSAVVPAWATLIEADPNPAVVTDAALRTAIAATNIAWRVRDNGTGMELLLVPPGVFQMGCPLCYSQDNPVHTVTLTNPFYIGRYEVTQAQWSATLGSNPSYFSDQPGSANFPVEMVSWNDINGFLIATGMRMPTEAEWEFACRAGTTTAFYNGSEVGSLGAIAWWHNNSGGRTHAVGERLPNALGLFDMLGNVWEWVSDWYGPISTDAATNPTGANQPYNPDAGHVRRGGSWWFDICDPTESWGRACDGSGINATFHVGFRAARSP